MTAATPTGPASGPRPTSSTPATQRWPLAKASRSKSKWGVVVSGRGGGATFFFTFFTPLATNRAFRWTAGYRSRGARAKAPNANAGGRDAMHCASAGARIGYSEWMEPPDPLLERVSAALATVPGVVAVALGGSRATGAAHASSDTDIGLYFSERAGLDVHRLLEVVKGLVDEPAAAQVREVGGSGPWIVGGGWLTITGIKVDLLYIGRSSRSRRSF